MPTCRERIATTSTSTAGTTVPTTSSGWQCEAHSTAQRSRATARTSIAEAHGAAIRDAFVRLWADPEWSRDFARSQAERARAFWSTTVRRRSRRTCARRGEIRATSRVNDTGMQRCAASRIPRSDCGTAISAPRAWARDDGTRRARQAESRARHATSGRRSPPERSIGVGSRPGRFEGGAPARLRPVGVPPLSRCDCAVHGPSRRGATTRSSSVRDLPGDHDVYCLTVPEAGNFALKQASSSATAASS